MAEARLFHWEHQAPPIPRETIRIEGGWHLENEVPISVSANAAFKLLAAATLTGERCCFPPRELVWERRDPIEATDMTVPPPSGLRRATERTSRCTLSVS